MRNLSIVEECYRNFTKDLGSYLPEGIIEVDLEYLHKLDLLNFQKEQEEHDSMLTRYFHVIESFEKITLINDDFVIWIIPEKLEDTSVTYTLIALNQLECPQLEVAFVTSGVYNNSRLVLKVLEKNLFDIQENEDMISKLA